MNNLTIRHRIIASFALIIGLVAVMGTVTYNGLTVIEKDATALLADSVAGLQISGELRGALGDNYAITGRSLVSNEDSARLATSTANIERLLGAYQATLFSDADRRNAEAATTAITAHLALPKDASTAQCDAAYVKAKDALGVMAARFCWPATAGA